MTFQASDLKGHQYFGHFNSFCAKAMRIIINYTPIGEYRLRFFPWEDFNCLCSNYPIKTRCHILYKYKRYNEY